LERNEELQKLRNDIQDHLQTIEDLKSQIANLQDQLDQAGLSGAEGMDKLRKEIQRLMDEVETIKAKARKDHQDLEQRLQKQKANELEQQQKKYEKIMEDLKRSHE
jgi:ABC-type transporter Mla subunit MlaD